MLDFKIISLLESAGFIARKRHRELHNIPGLWFYGKDVEIICYLWSNNSITWYTHKMKRLDLESALSFLPTKSREELLMNLDLFY